jgi:hypothetical protein
MLITRKLILFHEEEFIKSCIRHNDNYTKVAKDFGIAKNTAIIVGGALGRKAEKWAIEKIKRLKQWHLSTLLRQNEVERKKSYPCLTDEQVIEEYVKKYGGKGIYDSIPKTIKQEDDFIGKLPEEVDYEF